MALAGSTGCSKSKKRTLDAAARTSGSAARAATEVADQTASISKKGKKGRRKLWGKGKGRFKTKGKYGSASVRGTRWLTENRCNRSTFFKVTQGVIKVRDLVKKKDVKLKKGEQYVARAGRDR